VATYPRLFTPLKIGPCTIKNRIVSSGHDTVMIEHGEITDQLVAYHEARAAGGTGLIIMQVAGVHHTARYTAHVLMAIDDTCIPGYRRVAETVHAFGTKLFGQLFHPGREVMESQDGSSPVALAPSAVPNERFHVMPRALTRSLIAEIIDGYSSAAARLAQAGLDGVEIVASHGYLPSQFLNPNVNRREDGYGGSPENRLRFLREIVEAVRDCVGSQIVVGVRISEIEHDPNGLPEDVALATCEAIAASGLVDYLSVTVGTSATLAGSDHIVPAMNIPNAYTAPAAAKVRDLVDIPVFVAGRINQPQEAERLLVAGQADACIMNRALICDPTFPALAESGHGDEMRACIACNQACIGHFHAGYPISCIQRPETGRELQYGRVHRAARARRVMVVGAGPGGMKAAVVAAARGHEVTLYERSGRPGGQVLLAERLPERAEFGGAATNLLAEVERSSVKVVLHTEVDRAMVEAEEPDFVVVATGARPRHPEIEVMGEPTVLDAWQVIQGAEVPSGRTVVADWRGDWVGIGVARLLAERGRRVTLAVNTYNAGAALQQYVRDSLVGALATQRIAVVPLVRLFGVDEDSVYLQHVLTGEPVILEGVSSLVLALGHDADSALLSSLEDSGQAVAGVGDCLAPRSVEEAVLEGLQVGSTI
jgi:2,4-dienoyl-CoA reductase-like NADH-dependent reductase (Old Yellow Enzyme family)/thioredoxin reductase